MKLNIGCGRDILEGWENIDIKPQDDRVKYCDLEKPLHYNDNKFSVINAFNILEHIRNLDQLLAEIYRITKPDGIINIEVPHFSGSSAFCTEHINFFRLDSFDTPTGKERQTPEFDYKFNVIFRELTFNRYHKFLGGLLSKNPALYEGTFIRNIIPAESIFFTLGVNK